MDNLESYIKNLRKSIKEKLFFVRHLPDDDYVFFDFGCADGSLIKALYHTLSRRGHQNCYVGYDISKEMIHFAKARFLDPIDNTVLFTSNRDEAMRFVQTKCRQHEFKKVFILSSVIHEVYSFAPSVDEFWHFVLHSGFDYIVVRDMMPSKDICRESDSSQYNAVLHPQNPEALNTDFLAEFERRWGNLSDNRNLVHFLLKYRWTDHWDHENAENYFPLFVEDFIEIMTAYRTVCLVRFRVKFLEKQIYDDFGIRLTDHTHIKAVFAAKDT